MLKTNILSLPLTLLAKEDILEQIKKGERKKTDFLHILSINPENVIIALERKEFKRVVVETQSHIPDGIGVVLAVRLLMGRRITRLTGIDMMETLLEAGAEYSLRVVLIGGKTNLADDVSKCYKKRFPSLNIAGTQGILDISRPTREEEKAIFRIVSITRPHLIFVSFGSPQQELWIDRHKNDFEGAVVMGVGGAFDFIAGEVPRASAFFRKTGLEWLYRLVKEPRRAFRQLRLVKFMFLVFGAKLKQWSYS
jgi:N-acetylglucosaminyldiphosphoundecaprenol N-acetyl-beta-D-mannosaminyltransferase